MRFVAMKLHTKEQAPKEGGRETPAEAKPMAQWQPTTEGYLNFLVQSKLVYETMEEIVTNEELAIYKDFQNTGLERSAALEKDIAWFKETQGLEPKEIAPDSAAAEYSTLLKQLAKEDPPAFICHFYNTYFAHSAGGRMIGKKMSEMLLDGETLEFYQWEGELSELLEAVRAKLNTTAEGWTREQKDVCLEETEKAFQYSGQVMRTLFSAE
ncbi:Heme oxygenase 1, variant 2 [Cymbomonas tetramitiformis]|uniref:heme oxygenase (biliverdin-producing) n=1 Tax=Cymbomonas tetramitiformis TaxID=36881 RepID=A0AAE0GPY8_9CHLO|nr:Heme oxygenase 1, variant 2 [Cymbomonas tetramitiformis]